MFGTSVEFLRNLCLRLMLVAVLAMPMGAYAANGCEDEENDSIVAELALCSTHAYNIGALRNPEGSDRELMEDVIAMKTTLITQQMYRQYEQMASMLRRLKTQLEKAVLTTGMQAAGAKEKTNDDSGSSSGGSSYKSSNRNVKIEGARDCNQEMEERKVLDCLNSNFQIIYEASGNGANASPEARKQLANDFNTLGVTDQEAGWASSATKAICAGNDGRGIRNRKVFEDCLDSFRTILRSKYTELQNKERQAQFNPWGAMMGGNNN